MTTRSFETPTNDVVQHLGTSLQAPTLPERSTASLTNRRMILGAAVGVLILSAVLSLGEGPEQVLVPILNRPLPPLCAMKRYIGLDCPGCGLTRSFIAVGHGRWQEAWQFNPAGPLWFVLVAAQIPWQLLQLRRLKQGKPAIDSGWCGQALLWSALSALILQWVVRQLG
jgi:hypothetical protein